MDMFPANEISAMSTIRPTAWRRACVACTRAKRQCTKQVPRCQRCIDKGLPCAYPPSRRPETPAAAGIEGTSSRPDVIAPYPDEGLVTVSADSAELPDVAGYLAFDFLEMPGASSGDPTLPIEVGPLRGLPHTGASSDALVNLRGAWFLAAETWAAEFTAPPPTTTRENERTLKRYIEQVQLWMRQWVTDGHSQLHHRELYSFHMPRHVQDAYTAMAMYMGRTRETESTAHRIIEDRVAQLLQEQAVEESLGGSNAGGSGPSIFDRLSRVQSMLCYQVIRLFDGDIRMRGQAEALIPTLFMWNKQLLESAKEGLGRPERFLASTPFDPNLPLGTASGTVDGTAPYPKLVWRAWIVAESVRRTWQVASVIQEVYQFLRRGWSECPGRLPTTMRKTLWDAPSAYSWARELGAGKDPLLASMARLDDIFAKTPPTEVDDFNIMTIGLYGMEKADRWLEEGCHGGRQPASGELENMLRAGFTT